MMNHNSPIALAVKLEECRQTTIDDLVINLCIEAAFLTNQDIKKNSGRYQWIVKLTEHCKDAMALEDVIEGEVSEPLNSSNWDSIMANKKKQADEIVEIIAKQVMLAIPPYRA
ncbi:hypothetical protein BBM62_01825 [Vibrio parahaemolyticus]|uniref:hypothetical protein n=1 Tax=Vibrio parahaemolyticus TaxID=670 RepID=UPI0006A641F3|nr:hypothetical protein [Vibrio parahaemolyticus]EJD0685025.1 hypothetical protein [Vibrio parahaemolyticus]EJI6219844.1 hypothetical protein [Vibrio parahaemolyticus]KOE78844.1 hypothetical protein ACS87_02730 [Vibrio parahaemolyticus]OEA50544.1 hypothetical protein BBM62_01825 [Vibrio parahaemolyticus]HAS6494093.1 hypothetical protein [Vibrio parahaemolyticus]